MTNGHSSERGGLGPTPLALIASLAVAVSGAESHYDAIKRDVKAAIARDPFDATVATVLGGAFLFYVAEKGHNPKVNSYWDALVFTSTCLSVGYADVFARTPAGKAIAAALMTFGPAMSGALLEPTDGSRPSGDSPGLQRLQDAIVGKLDAILTELRASR